MLMITTYCAGWGAPLVTVDATKPGPDLCSKCDDEKAETVEEEES